MPKALAFKSEIKSYIPGPEPVTPWGPLAPLQFRPYQWTKSAL